MVNSFQRIYRMGNNFLIASPCGKMGHTHKDATKRRRGPTASRGTRGSQPGGPGTVIYSPCIELAVGMEPGSAVDGDGTSGNERRD